MIQVLSCVALIVAIVAEYERPHPRRWMLVLCTGAFYINAITFILLWTVHVFN